MSVLVLPRVSISWGDMVRQDYVHDRIDVETMERELEMVLWHNQLPPRLFGGLSPFPMPEMDVITK